MLAPVHDPASTPASLAAAADLFATLALQAGAAIMRVLAKGAVGSLKADRSPVCEADTAAEAIILQGLAEGLPEVPVVSEEAAARGEIPRTNGCFVLVDPLDGTREFLSGSREFTVNLALIVDGVPRAGVVYAPALDRLWLGDGTGAATGTFQPGVPWPDRTALRAVRTRLAPATLTALVSRSHPDSGSEAFLARCPIGDRRPAGSSLKFCLLAEGEGDVYPRASRIMQWDVAAGDAVLRAAGGLVVDASGAPLRYGPAADGFWSPPFVAWGDPASDIALRATLR